jgi:hypothetical protein
LGRLRGTFTGQHEAVVRVIAGRYHAKYVRGRCRVPHRLFHFHLRSLPPFPSCEAAPGRTLASSAEGHIYQATGVDELGRTPYAYGCLFGGQRLVLGRSEGNDPHGGDLGNLAAFKLAGPYVSFEELWNEIGSVSDSLDVVDLRGSGSTARAVRYAAPDKASSFDGVFEKTILTPFGSVAWIGSYCLSEWHCVTAQLRYEVWIADAAGQRRLDIGRKIRPKSLVLRGGEVVWSNNAAERSAPIDAGSAPPSTGG